MKELAGFFVGYALAMFIALCGIVPFHNNKARDQAVEAGVAEYYINEEGEKDFRYLECDE